jgi:hypothetical protein
MMGIIPLIFTVIGPFSAIDVAGWIAHGNYFLEHHTLLIHDIFSVLPTRPLVYPSWGIAVIYALIYRVSGLTAVCLFHSVLLCGLLALIYQKSILTLKNPTHLTARLAVYFVWLGAVNALGERPSMVALIPMLLAYLEIAQLKKSSDVTSKFLVKLCLINIVWVNIHGSFILLWLMFGWKTLFLALSDKKIARLGLAHLFIGLSSLINPFTWRVFPYVWETMQMSHARLVPEWAPTTPGAHFPTGLLYFVLLPGAMVLVMKRFRRPGFLHLISSPFFVLLLNGLSAIRNATLPFVVLLPFMKENGFLKVGDEAQAQRERMSLNLASALAFFAIFVLVLPPFKPMIARFLPPDRREIFDETAIPGITHAIEVSGRVCPIFNAPDLGSFLMLKLPNQIFLDSRNVIYTEAEFRDYDRASQAQPGWEQYLDRYHACFAVLSEAANAPLISALRASGGWTQALEEKGNVLFKRK